MLFIRKIDIKSYYKKNKKRALFLLIALIIYCVIIFSYGYKIPWFDKHPSWPYFPEHTNQNIVIEQVFPKVFFNSIIEIKNKKILLIGYKKNVSDNCDSLYITDNHFNLLLAEKLPELPKNECFIYPELANNRLIIKCKDTIRTSWGNHQYIYISYDLDKLNKSSLPDDYYKNLIDSNLDKFNLDDLTYKSVLKNKNSLQINFIGFRTTRNEFKKGSWWHRFDFRLGDNGYTSKPITYPSKFEQHGYGYFELKLNDIKTYFKIIDYNDNQYFYEIPDTYNASRDTICFKYEYMLNYKTYIKK